MLYRLISMDDQGEVLKAAPVTVRVKGEYQNPGGYSPTDQENFSSCLPRFLFAGVSTIRNFSSFEVEKTIVFSAEFQLRPEKGDEWLFNLDFWPLGVRRLHLI